MQVHEVESNSTLQIALDTVDCDRLSHVDYTAETEIRLSNRLVHPFIGIDPSTEISLSFFSRHALIIGVTRLYFECDVGSDNSGVIAA